MSKNNPIASVYGDTGSVEATYTKDLNTIGNDPYVKVQANSGEFNLFQQLTLQDNFYDSRYEEVYVTQNSAGTANATSLASLQFNTMGWTRVDRMYLQIPVVFNQVVSNSWHASNTDGDLYNHLLTYPDPNLKREYLVKQRICPENCGDSFEKYLLNFIQTDFALMSIFNRIAIYGGNNNQPIGRTQSFFLEGLKTQLRDVPWNENTIKILGNWGLPVSNLSGNGPTYMQELGADTLSQGSFFPNYSVSSYMNNQMEIIPDSWARQWANLIASIDDETINGGSFDWLDTTNRHSIYQQSQMNIVLPLSYINNFFRHKTYLPPDFKLKIDIEGVSQSKGSPINFNCPLIVTKSMNEFSTRLLMNETHDATLTAISAGINFSQIKLVYQNHTLRQPIQAQINEKWLSYPIVYNYETFEQYDVDNSGQNSGVMIVRDIAISQQRPTQLIFQIIDTVTQCVDFRGDFPLGAGPPMNWTIAGKLQTPYQLTAANVAGINVNNAPHGTCTIGSTPWFSDLANPDYPLTVAGSLSQKGHQPTFTNFGAPGQACATNYPQITTMSVLIGGRTQYYYKNDTFIYNQGNTLLNAYDVLIAEQDAECYKDYSTETNVLKNPLNYQAFGGLGSFMRLVIAPGGYVNTADLPTDLGATVIRVQVTLSKPLPSTKKLQIIKKMPEQIAVDTNKNLTLIMWPAIKSNNGFSIPNVVNTQ